MKQRRQKDAKNADIRHMENQIMSNIILIKITEKETRKWKKKKNCDWSRKQSSEMGSKNKSLWKKCVNIDT